MPSSCGHRSGGRGRPPTNTTPSALPYDEAFDYSKQWQKPEDWQKEEAVRQRAHEASLVLVTQPDNAGRAEWRKRRAPTTHLMLPPKFQADAQEECFKPQYSRRADLLANHFPQLFEVARTHGVQVELRPIFFQDDREGQRRLRLNIFGPNSQAELAKKEMLRVISQLNELMGQRSASASKFAKVNAKSEAQRAAEDKNFEEYLKAREFCKEPAEDAAFARCATFSWPIGTVKAKPHEILGSSFEALDPIRMEQLCHVTCDRSKWLFKIQGNDAQNVKEALKRLRNIYYQVIARGIYCETRYLTQPRGATSKPKVELMPMADGRVRNSKKPVGRGTPPKIELMDVADDGDVDEKRSDALKHERISIIKTLSRLEYYNGSLALRFRLGSFYLTNFEKQVSPTMRREDFDAMMQKTEVAGEVTKYFPGGFMQKGLLSGDVPKNLRIQTSTYFVPDEADADADQGKQNRSKASSPWLSAPEVVLNGQHRYYEPRLSFTIQLKDKDGLVNLDVDFIPDINGHLDTGRHRWSLVPEKQMDKKLFDLNYVNVDADSAWNLELTASHAVGEDRLPLLSRFINREHLKLKTDPRLRLDPRNTDLLLDLKPLPSLNILSIHQRKVWKYSILPSEKYSLELALVQPFLAGAVEWSSLKIPSRKEDPYWTAHVTSDDWTQKLSPEGQLGVGKGDDWKISSQDLFPPSVPEADGFAELVHRVERLAVGLKEHTVRPVAPGPVQSSVQISAQPARNAPAASSSKPPSKSPRKPPPRR